MRAHVAAVLLLAGAACAGEPGPRVRRPRGGAAAAAALAGPVPRARGDGASPGGERGPGGFVPRREARTFYAAGGGRLWYYLNAYYWAPQGLPSADLWIRAKVVEKWAGLRRWPDLSPVPDTPPKVTVEYWKVGPSGRTVVIDNHKDFCLLADGWCAGAIEAEVTLALGGVRLRGRGGAFARPPGNYVLEHRSYDPKAGVGRDAVRFEPLAGEPETVWGYRVPWSSSPAPLTRSVWEGLRAPAWRLLERREPSPPERPPAQVTLRDSPPR